MVFKWIFGYLGWVLFGPLAGIIGYGIGGAIDTLARQNAKNNLDDDYDDDYTPTSSEQAEGDRNSFFISMLAMSAYIIRADGRVMHSEMETVRAFLRNNFGEAAVVQGNEILLKLFDHQKNCTPDEFKAIIKKSCADTAHFLDYSARLQLLNFLVSIAAADGSVDASEVDALREVAEWMQMDASEVDSMLHIGGDSLEDAYKVLGVSPDVSNDELKRTYRRLALEHHPDRVAKLGEDIRRAAEKKFQQINAAKEIIWKARGM